MSEALRNKNIKAWLKNHIPAVIFILVVAAIGTITVISRADVTTQTSTSQQSLQQLNGDINGDGTVNIMDLSILLSHYNTAYTSADLNQDGTVTILDLSILLSNYGKSTAPVSIKAYGYSAHILRQSDPDAYTTLASNGGATTIRDDFSWNSIETTKGSFNWSNTDKLITYAANHNLHLLIMAGTSPTWASGSSASTWLPPINAADYGNFAGKVAARYGTNGTFWSANPSVPKVLPAGIEIWNEPNLNIFWGSTTPDPVKYTAMLKSAYTAVKAADPNMSVITGGLSPAGGYNDVDCNNAADSGSSSTKINGLNFLQSIYANGGAGYFDAVGYHPYNFSANATAAQMLNYHLCSAWSQMAQTPVSVVSLMAAHGDSAKKVWATELGAPTCITGATYVCVSETEQSNLATQEVSLWKSYSWSGNYYWYDLRDDSGGASLTDREQHFGAVRANNALKPAYTSLKTGFTAL